MKILEENRTIKYELNSKIYLENEFLRYTTGPYSMKTNIFCNWFGFYFNYNSAVRNWVAFHDDFLDFNLIDL